MGIRNFIESHYSHFNAGELANCIYSDSFLDLNTRMCQIGGIRPGKGMLNFTKEE